MRPEKKSIINEYSESLNSSQYVLLADCRGLTVEQFAELRSKLRETGSSIQVVKNGLFRQALSQSGKGELEGILQGPIAMICGDGDVTILAKDLKEFQKGREKPEMRGGEMDGVVLTIADIQDLANIPPREILLGKFVGTLAAPMSQLVGVMNQKAASLLYVLRAIEEKKVTKLV